MKEKHTGFVGAYTVVIALAASLANSCHAQERERPDKYKLDLGRFAQVNRSLSAQTSWLRLRRGNLVLKFSNSDETSDLVKRIMGEVSGGGGGNSSIWEFDRHDFNCHMSVSNGFRIGSSRRFRNQSRKHVEIVERNYPFRLMEMTEQQDQIELFYHDIERQVGFWLIQNPGTVHVFLMEGPECTHYAASSAIKLAVENDLSSILENKALVGFGLDELLSEDNEIARIMAEDEDDESVSDLPKAIPGFYGTARASLSEFVNLTSESGRITVDRQGWKDYLKADSAKQLIQRAQDEFAESGLPKTWLLPGRDSFGSARHLDYYDFPQILFEHYLSEIGRKNSRIDERRGFPVSLFHLSLRGPRSRSFNRRVNRNEIFNANMTMHTELYGMEEGQKDYLSLEIHDAISRDTRVRLYEKPDETFSLLIKSGKERELLWLFQDHEGKCWLHHLALEKATSKRAGNFQDLYDQNRDLFSSEIHDLFRDLGVNVDAKLGGPLEIQDTESPYINR